MAQSSSFSSNSFLFFRPRHGSSILTGSMNAAHIETIVVIGARANDRKDEGKREREAMSMVCDNEAEIGGLATQTTIGRAVLLPSMRHSWRYNK